MSNLEGILKSAAETVQIVEDPELRKIAFQEVLRHSLRSEFIDRDRGPQLAQEAPRRLKKRTPPAARTDSPLTIRPEAAALDFSPDDPGLVSWSSLSADWKKFCWILEAARQEKVDGLSNSEISYLVDKVFREAFAPKVVNNLKVQIKKGMVRSVAVKSGDREYQVWKILAAGIREVTAKSAAAPE